MREWSIKIEKCKFPFDQHLIVGACFGNINLDSPLSKNQRYWAYHSNGKIEYNMLTTYDDRSLDDFSYQSGDVIFVKISNGNISFHLNGSYYFKMPCDVKDLYPFVLLCGKGDKVKIVPNVQVER